MNIRELNLEEISSIELLEINGGTAAPSWLRKLGWGYLAQQVVDNWDDIKSGFSAGYNAANP
ncbi:hypothetical protein [Flavobacterium sp.]|jgi:hypothetical protein|uniref:hypothetical protein n=1 Tax=Flavobacterium sp. TaxID=239 RepID=UPI0037BE5DC6